MGNKFGDAYGEWQRKVHREAMKPRRRGGSSGGGRQKRGGAASGVISAAFGAYTALSGLQASAASGALPGHQDDASDFGRNLYNSSRQADRDWQSRQVEGGTRDRGRRSGWSSQGN